MSDPLTNLEIADVLSSIRRLVAEDLKSAAPAKREVAQADVEASVDDAPRAQAAGALVLTPAFRVPDSDDEAALRETISGGGMFEEAGPLSDTGETEAAAPSALATDWDEDAREDHEGGGAVGPSATLEDTIAELEAAVAGIEAEFEPDGSEVAEVAVGILSGLDGAFAEASGDEEISESDGPIGAEEGPGDEGVEAAPFVAADVAPGDEGVEPGAVADDVEAALEDTVVATEAAEDIEASGAHHMIDERAGRLDPEATDAEQAPMFRRAVTTERAPLAGWTVEPADIPEEAAADQEAEIAEEPAAEVSTSRIRRLHLAPQDDEPEAPEPLGEVEPEAAEDDSLFEEGDEPLIDMETLRVIVAELIRHELQGTLGERITRNVRKLVRREINRALEERNLS